MPKFLKILLVASFFFTIIFALSSSVEAGVTQKQSLNSGLVGYWSFNEGTTTTALDYSGKKNKGTLVGGVAWTNGKMGKALSFDGVNGYVVASTSPSLVINSSFTVSCWIKLRALPGSSLWSTCIAKGDNSESARLNHNYSLGLDNAVFGTGQAVIVLYENSSATNFQARWQTSISLNVWHHFVGVFNDSADTLTLYVDNIPVASSSATGVPDTGATSFYIGQPKTSASANGFINGLIDDVRVYNRALSSDEVRNLYNSAASTRINSSNSGLVGYWSFNEGTSTTALDYSGKKKTGALVGPTWVNGIRGKALKFDGTDDYVSFPDPNESQTTISAFAWIKAGSGSSNGKQIVTHYGGGTNNRSWALQTSQTAWPSNGDQLAVVLSADGTINSPVIKIYYTNKAILDNKWHHVGFTFASGALKLYVDGFERSVTKQTDGTVNSLFNHPSLGGIGATNVSGTPSSFWNGLIDEARIYTRTISAKEVLALYQAGAVKHTPPANSNLVGYWSFNEGTSTTALDYSGKKNKGTLIGTPTWTNGKLGKALAFDGSNDTVAISNEANFDFERTQAFSASAWVYPNTNDTTQVIIGKRDNSVPSRGWAFSTNAAGAGKLTVIIMNNNTNNAIVVDASSTIPLIKWSHVVFTYNGSSVASGVRIYVNGAPISTGSTQDNLTATILTNLTPYVGSFNGATNFWDGKIDEARVYNRVLSPSEVWALYKSK